MSYLESVNMVLSAMKHNVLDIVDGKIRVASHTFSILEYARIISVNPGMALALKVQMQ